MIAPHLEPALFLRAAAARIGENVDGRYRIDRVLGVGGLGAVYQAQHLGLQRDVALKMMHGAFRDDRERRGGFEREAHALSVVDHPNVVAISDFGAHEDVPYIAMELIQGKSLYRRLQRRRPSVEQALVIVDQLLEGLAAAHAAGVVHRDLKPSNIMVEVRPGGLLRTHIVDFGLAHFSAPTPTDGPEAAVFQLGAIVGTPRYMAPELTTAVPIDERADLYSVGIILYEMLVGRCPFVHADDLDTIHSHLTEEPPPPGALRPGLCLSPALESLLRKSLAKSRSDRFASATAMREALAQLPTPAATAPGSEPPPAP